MRLVPGAFLKGFYKHLNVISGGQSPKTAILQRRPHYSPPLPRPLVRAHLLVTLVVFMIYLGRNHALLWGGILNRVFESTNYTHENTGAGHNF